MLTLARRLGSDWQGRIEFAFIVVFWLVLLVRDGLEIIAAREIARHPRLTRHLVNHILAIKGMLALGLYGALIVGRLGDALRADRADDPGRLRPDAVHHRDGAGLRLPRARSGWGWWRRR